MITIRQRLLRGALRSLRRARNIQNQIRKYGPERGMSDYHRRDLDRKLFRAIVGANWLRIQARKCW